MLSRNLQFTDAAFVSLAFDAATLSDLETILHLDEECSALKLPTEMRMASQKLGIRLLKIFNPILTQPLLTGYQLAIESKKATAHYSIAFGMISQILGIQKEEALTGFFYNAAAGMVTNCVKLIPLGQQDGQEVLFSLRSGCGCGCGSGSGSGCQYYSCIYHFAS